MAGNQHTGLVARIQDLTGRRFGRLTAVGYSHTIKKGKSYTYLWVCRCECGTEKIVAYQNLKSGRTLSCGCLQQEKRMRNGLSGTSEYYTYHAMLGRCHDATDIGYPQYGGRGITVCDRWRYGEDGKDGVTCFLEDMGRKPSKTHSIDRRDGKLGYFKDNCRWASKAEQAENRWTTVFISISGETRSVSEWARISGLQPQLIRQRHSKHWPDHEMLSPTSYKHRTGRKRKSAFSV